MTKERDKAHIPPPPKADATADELAAYFEKYGMDELEAAGYVHELTPAEQQEMDRLAEESKARVAVRKNNRAQLNLAMSADQLERFTNYANRKHIPPSTLAKAWILERLDEEARET
jgi:hypothetical protein